MWRFRSRQKQTQNRSLNIFLLFLILIAMICVVNKIIKLFVLRDDRQDYARLADKFNELEEKHKRLKDNAQKLTPQDGVWQPVAGTSHRFYVYSAFIERRTEPAIRVIGATKRRDPEEVRCQIHLTDGRMFILPADVKAIRENWSLRFSAVFIMCQLPNDGLSINETIGATVAIVAKEGGNTPPSNMLRVLDTAPKDGIEKTIHICVKPFYARFDRPTWLIEWVELNRLLGVTHFYMYNKTLSRLSNCIINYYKREYGIVTIRPWKLPMVSLTEISLEGQFAAFNDCLYRSMASADWLLVIDADEVVIPRRMRTLHELLEQLTQIWRRVLRKKIPAVFLFRNAFFYLLWKDDPLAPAPLLTSQKTRRWLFPHWFRDRSKYVVRPRDAVELGNHFVWDLLPGKSSNGVPKELALLHHYRTECERQHAQGKCVWRVNTTVDRIAYKYSAELMERVANEKKLIGKTCHL